MTTLLQGIPRGKTRVIGIDLFSHEDYHVGDYDDRSAAFREADANNRGRVGAMDDVYYVYNDSGQQIRSEKAVANETNNLGVHP